MANQDEKKIVKQTFEGGRDTDTADQLLPANMFRRMQNMLIYKSGSKRVAKAITGNTLIDNILPAGNNLCIGKERDEERNCFYYCIWNSNGFHTIYKYDRLSKVVNIVLQSRTDSNDVDILRWSNLKQYRINSIDIIEGRLFTFVDALNKARKFNIAKAMDKTSAGYGTVIYEDFITAYKQTAVYSPACNYITDPTRNANNLYGNLYKFTVRWLYDDKEQSNWSDWSLVPKPSNQSYTGVNTITFDNNCIQVTVATGNKLVKKIEIAFQANTTTDGIENNNFLICASIDKEELLIADNSSYIYNFYNDGSYVSTNQDKINRNYSFLPRIPVTQSFVKSAMTYTNAEEGWPVVRPIMTVGIRMDELFIPPDTENKLSNASLIVERQSVDRHQDSFLSKSRYNTVTKFTIGAEVKKGVQYFIFGRNGDSDNYYFAFTATLSDTASTIASQMKAALRGIGRGYPSNEAAISAEGTDIDGNVFFSYGYLGEYAQSVTDWTGAVTQVSYTSLKDNGTSVQIIPYGCITNYAVVYVDDDGRESLGYASALSVIRTPYITEIGSYKLPVHIITINHTPPIMAKYWKLVRSPQNHGVEILIQKVIEVTTDNTSDYLDLVVGSLFTYQKLHENTIITYEFAKGDRIRLIKNVDTGAFYTGYYETEILSYKDEVDDLIDDNVSTHGTDHIQTGKPVRTDYVGKVISILGNERTIISTSGSDYVLDSPISLGTIADEDDIQPSYRIIDRRGIIRIKKLQGVTIADNSQVELFKPQSLSISPDYKIYQDFSQKFEITGWGTDTRYHKGNVQNQTASQPAIVEVNRGDAYVRDRELPVNNVVPGTQVLVSTVVDPNFSDFYHSDISDLGRVYPQDNGLGIIKFGSRTRYSNNYLEDTDVNGMSDFDNLSRVDNNDAYGDILLTKFLNRRLHVFKPLKDGFIPVRHTLTTGTDGKTIQVQTDKLLNEFVPYDYEGGIGNNPESVFVWTNWIYHASTNSGAFCRIGGEGVEPISSQNDFDSEAKRILGLVDKYDLAIPGEFDQQNQMALWSIAQHTEYLLNGGFVSGEWSTSVPLLSDSITYEVTQQSATGMVTYDGTLKSFVITGTALGDDYFLYRPVLGGGMYGTVKKQCFTTVQAPNRPVGYQVRTSSAYCLVDIGGNTGLQGWKVLEGIYLDDMSLDGFKRPNIAQVSAQDLVPEAATITYNYPTDVAPSGGSNGDIWYNPVADNEYKKIAGVWTLLTDRVTNDQYVAPVVNTDACPITASANILNNITSPCQYYETSIVVPSEIDYLQEVTVSYLDITIVVPNTYLFAVPIRVCNPTCTTVATIPSGGGTWSGTVPNGSTVKIGADPS